MFCRQGLVSGEYPVVANIPFPPTHEFLKAEITNGDGIHLSISDADGYFVKINKTFELSNCPVGYGFDNWVNLFLPDHQIPTQQENFSRRY